MAHGGYKFLFDVDDAQVSPVFYDPTRTRRGRMRRVALAAICVLLTWIILFVGGTVSLPRILQEMGLYWQVREPVQTAPPADGQFVKAQPRHSHPHYPEQMYRANAPDAGHITCNDGSAPAFAALADGLGERVIGHIPTAMEWAPLSLASSCGELDVVAPDWLSITSGETALIVDIADESVREAVETYRRTAASAPELMPTVLLETGYDTEAFLEQMRDPKTAAALAGDMMAALEAFDANGLCLDFRQLDGRQLAELRTTFEIFTTRLRGGGWRSCIVLSTEQEIWAEPAFTALFDNVVLKAFRQPWVGSPPGPLASDAWFEDVAVRALKAVGPERLTLALGNFAAEWTTGQPVPRILPYAEAVQRVSAAGADLGFSRETGNSFSTYRGQGRDNHKLWMLDAVSLHNQIRTLRQIGVRSIGIWSLGSEDPGIWEVLQDESGDPNSLGMRLSEPKLPHYVAYRGEGSFLRVLSAPEPGQRLVDVDPVSGRFKDVTYQRLPRSYLIEKYGQPEPHKLVLTFDDGPHPDYTTAILDTLQDTATPAAFFVVGTRVMEEPGLLRRIIDDGHEVGSHTFSHPRMDQISQSRTELELGMMHRLLAGYSGHTTRLYREPFLRAGGPIQESRVQSLQTVQATGGIVAGMDIVPKDWEGISAESIADYVIEEVNNGNGNVIVMHDGGQNRDATVEALPVIIEELTAQGYEFTTLADLLGVSRASLMPVATGQWRLFDRLSFDFISVTWFSLEAVFWVVLCIGAARMLIILLLARLRQRPRPVDSGYAPKVTVVIPAYNEENVITKCIRSVLASDYDNFDVMVVDDGSHDDTFTEILRFRNHPRVEIFAQLNQGKWSALNAAVANTDTEVVVCIDADTEIDPAALGHLARQFANPRVGAVAGKITVGNRNKLLTRLQALEYITSQNFERRAYDLINGMLVVPGAIGAWRTSAVREAGRYCNDTMTEDADLTIAVNRAGYRVTYEEHAVAYTEAPESIAQLLAQRLRWSLGMFQSAWKHKGAFREGRSIGLFSIPDMFIFGYLFPLLAPIADLFVLLLLYKFFSGTWSGEVGVAVADAPTHLIWAYLALPLLDLVVAAYALRSDKRESLRLLWLFPFQRFFYRQLLYFSVYRSVLRALGGSLAGWGRMRRVGREYYPRST